MGVVMYRCECCGTTDAASPVPPEDMLCAMCHNRGRRCMHNRQAGVTFHSSRPHWDDTGKDDPGTCQWCLARLL